MERSAYRIIDANFNRAREACRVIEEFCRFSLNNAELTSAAKQLRHELCAVINNLDHLKLLTARDTLADVGVGSQIENQMTRNMLYDSFTAACKRLPEALRAIAEVLKPTGPKAARTIEQLRYRSYTLEKDIVLSCSTAEKFKSVKLYVIITSNSPAEILNLTNFCIEGAADCIQLRAKNISTDELFTVAKEMVELCRKANVLSIINDRTDIAVAAGADGVHLGQNDLPVKQARKLAFSPMIIGKSTHNMDQLTKAIDELPTYVGLGPVFPTSTKPGAESVGLDYIKNAADYLQDKSVAHVAIGGITAENVSEVIKAGANAVAVCSAITHVPNPVKACQNLRRKIEDSLP